MSITDDSVRAADSRVRIAARTLRRDRWWLQPVLTEIGLFAFVVYSTWVTFLNADYYAAPYISPFYSPCLSSAAGRCPARRQAPHLGWFGTWWLVTPAVIILIFPLGFRADLLLLPQGLLPVVVAVPAGLRGPRAAPPLHRRDPVPAARPERAPVLLLRRAGVQRDPELGRDRRVRLRRAHRDRRRHAVLVVNAVLLWLYSLSCHACRHAVGGRIDHFSRHPVRYRAWTFVSRLNPYHGNFAWASLVWVALTDLYVRLVASGVIHDPRVF